MWITLQVLLLIFIFFNWTNLNKVIYLEILTAIWDYEEWLFMPLLAGQSKFCSPKQGFFFFFELWIRFVCLQWTTAANIWYLQDSKQVAEVTFLASDLQEEGT